MPAFVALLRAVNVGGRGAVPMADLREMAARLGLTSPRTLLQSGNLVFSAASDDATALERRLEAAARADLALETDILVRSAAQWADVVAGCPYPEFARTDPSHLVAMPLGAAPAPEAEAGLRAAIVGRETFVLHGATVYLAYRDGIGRSKLTPAVLERHLGIGTGRNWNTVLKIAAALSA